MRDALRLVLSQKLGHSFYMFCRARAIEAFNGYCHCGIPLEHTMAHGNWSGNSSWTYLKASLSAPAMISQLFKSLCWSLVSYLSRVDSIVKTSLRLYKVLTSFHKCTKW